MPLSAEQLASDLRAIFADFPQTVTIRRRGKRPQTVPCASSEVGGAGTVGNGGAGTLFDDSVQVTVGTESLAWVPICGDQATIDDSPRGLRVSSIRSVPGDAAMVLTLEVTR